MWNEMLFTSAADKSSDNIYKFFVPPHNADVGQHFFLLGMHKGKE